MVVLKLGLLLSFGYDYVKRKQDVRHQPPQKIQSVLLLKLKEVKQVLAKKKYKRTTCTQNSCLYSLHH